MAVLSRGDSAPYADHLRPTLPGGRSFEEMPFGFRNHRPALWRLWCHRGAAIGYVCQHDRPGHDHGDASGSLLPCGRACAQLHARRRRVQRHATVADAGHQAARGRTRRRPVSPRAARRAIDRTRPAHASAAQAMLRGGDRRARTCLILQERRSRRAPDRADPFRRPVAVDSASRPDQAAVQPPGVPLSARQRPRSRASFSRRAKPSSALPPRSARSGTGSTPGRCSPKTFNSSSTRSIRWRRATKSNSAIFAPSNCCREITASMRRG